MAKAPKCPYAGCEQTAYALSYRATHPDGAPRTMTVPVPYRYCPVHGLIEVR